jgi:hypothetical protein
MPKRTEKGVPFGVQNNPQNTPKKVFLLGYKITPKTHEKKDVPFGVQNNMCLAGYMGHRA